MSFNDNIYYNKNKTTIKFNRLFPEIGEKKIIKITTKEKNNNIKIIFKDIEYNRFVFNMPNCKEEYLNFTNLKNEKFKNRLKDL